MPNAIVVKRGDAMPPLEVSLSYDDGTPIDLTTATAVKFNYVAVGGTVGVSRDMDVTDPDIGAAKYEWTEEDTRAAGRYRAEFEITFPAGKLTVPTRNSIPMIIYGDIA